MNQNFSKLLKAIAFCVLGLNVFSQQVSAQKFKVEAGKPIFEDFPSPRFGGVNQKSFNPKDWLEIEAELNIKMAPMPRSKTVGKILVKWYVAVKNPEKGGSYLLLTEEVNYVNVPLEEKTFVSIYLSPASIRFLTGSNRAGKKAVHLVGYEVLINGKKVAHQTNDKLKGKVDWWNVASPRVSRSEAVPLLDKNKTPFKNLWWDRYAEVLEKK